MPKEPRPSSRRMVYFSSLPLPAGGAEEDDDDDIPFALSITILKLFDDEDDDIISKLLFQAP